MIYINSEKIEDSYDVFDSDIVLSNDNKPDVSISSENFLEEFKQLLVSLDETKKINISLNHKFKDANEVVQIYLLSYRYRNFNFSILDLESRKIFKEVKSSLDNILKLKRDVCDGDSDLLKKILLSSYRMYHPIMQKIIDNTYPTDLSGKKVFLVDSHNFFHRTYHGMPYMSDSHKRPTALLKGLTTLIKSIMNEEPDYVIFANEGTSEVNVRKEIYGEYKSNRSSLPDDLLVQIKACLSLLNKMGFQVISEEGYEADDIIASYTKFFIENNASVIISTTDKDLFQLKNLSDKVNILNPMTQKFITEEDCIKKFGVSFKDCLLVQALMGDASDNIPGIKGVGIQSASKLIKEFGTLENLFKLADTISGKLGERIREGKDNAYVSLKLVSLNDNLAKSDLALSSTVPENPFQKVIDELASYEIRV